MFEFTFSHNLQICNYLADILFSYARRTNIRNLDISPVSLSTLPLHFTLIVQTVYLREQFQRRTYRFSTLILS